MGFADTTEVSPEKTRAEIETVLRKYKASSFASGWNDTTAFIAFQSNGRLIRFKIALPNPKDAKFTHVNSWTRRNTTAAERLYDQAVRTIWRRLLLCIRAKLESVESGIETFETAFAAHIVIPGTDQTVGDWIAPQIEAAYASGEPPTCLPGYVGAARPRSLGPGVVSCAGCGVERPRSVPACPACGSRETKS